MSDQQNEIVDPNAPAQPPAEEKKSVKEKAAESFSGVFFEKLKEQSFTILIMLAVV